MFYAFVLLIIIIAIFIFSNTHENLNNIRLGPGAEKSYNEKLAENTDKNSIVLNNLITIDVEKQLSKSPKRSALKSNRRRHNLPRNVVFNNIVQKRVLDEKEIPKDYMKKL